MDKVVNEYQKWANDVQIELNNTNIDWINQYSDYAKNISNNYKKLQENRKTFRVPRPFECYLTLGNAEKGNTTYDLRYLGQSVGNIYIDNNGVPKLYVDAKKNKSNEKYFAYERYFLEHSDNKKEKNNEIDESWKSGKKAKLFRKFFKEEVNKQKMPHSIEHLVEMRLFQEFARKSSVNKNILGIQPIKLGSIFTHMKTALKASESKKKKASASSKGGEIDIFCRRRVSSKETRLTVIEVKDKEEKGESFNEAMNQAIAYAVFIRELIRSSCGESWMKIWGINSDIKESITINAVVAIPVDSNHIADFQGKDIYLGKDKIELHYMAIDKSILDPDGEVRIETDL